MAHAVSVVEDGIFELVGACKAGSGAGGTTGVVTRRDGEAPFAEARWGLGLPVQPAPRLRSIAIAPELR